MKECLKKWIGTALDDKIIVIANEIALIFFKTKIYKS